MITRILPILFIVIAVGLFFVYINPVYTKKVLPLRQEIQAYNATLAAAADFNNKEAQLARDRSSIPADSITKLEAYLPDGVDNVQLILDLNALAARSGVQLSNFNIRSAGSDNMSGNELVSGGGGKAVESLDLTVKAVGTYNGFRTFLSGVERSLRPLDLVQMTLSDSATGVYSYDMTFRIYWLQ
jgi:hypothetical protein